MPSVARVGEANGRVYDPVLARFLSPDPYVQAPDFTQSFNRYAYCLNNPFKYVDPSGEFLTWSINSNGFSIGLNFCLAGVPLGFGVSVGFSGGGSVGIYGEVGYRVGCVGVTANQSLNFGFNGNVSTTSSLNIGASFGVFNVGANGSYTYDISNRNGGNWGWGVGAGVGLGGNGYSGVGLNIGYGSGGFTAGFNGFYDHKAYNAMVAAQQQAVRDNINGEVQRVLNRIIEGATPGFGSPDLAATTNVLFQELYVDLPELLVVGTFTRNSFSIDRAVEWLDNNTYASHNAAKAAGNAGRCAYYVRMALEAGGINTADHPVAARQYAPYLEKWGFTQVNTEMYQKGDIAVFQGYPGGTADPKTGIPYGHIQMYNGSNWVSYWVQRSFWANQKYMQSNYQIYR